jgi:autotransporter-associated beta strand protein
MYLVRRIARSFALKSATRSLDSVMERGGSRKRLRRAGMLAGAAIFGACSAALGQLVSFPGAQGFGEYTTGGRTGSVYVVTNLNDSGPGSFRDAVSQSNRIVVFAVGGIINLQSSISAQSNITILGQTAPGQGISLEGYELSFSDKSNLIMQYIRVREGSGDTDTSNASINLGDLNGGILDHVSAELSQYDNIDAVGANSAADNITYQNDLIADPIKSQQLNLHEEGNQTTYLNNIFANAHGRDPLAKSNDQYVNNVAYNYGYAYTTGDSQGKYKYDILNNYFIAGPSTTSPGDAWFQLDSNQSAYASGNMLDSNANGVLDGSPTTPGGLNLLSSEWSPETQFLPTLSASNAYTFDTTHAGDSLQYDQLDQQIISQVESLGTQGEIMNEPDDDGLVSNGFGTTVGGTVTYTSSAGDDIPDTWATEHGLNSTSLAGATLKNALGYDMIEEYAQQLGDEYSSQTWSNASGEWSSGTWAGGTPGIYNHALIRGGGSVTVSSGDNASAFSVSIGGSGGESLKVTGGSLTVQDTIYVGDQNNGAFTLSGGVVRANNVQLGNTIWNSSGIATNYYGTLNLTGGTLQVGQIVLGAGSPSDWTTGAIWTWNGGTVQTFGDLNINAPATLGSNGAFVNTTGPDEIPYPGVISGALGGAGPFTKEGGGTLTLSASNSYLGNTTVQAGILDITGSIAENGSANVFIAADSSGATQLVRATPSGASYDGYGSSVTSGLQSRADLLAGKNSTENSNGESVTMQWRLRQPSETPAGIDKTGLISEVLTLTGMANSGTAGTGQTDPFAMQMNFSTSYFNSSSAESFFARSGYIQLASLTGSTWSNTVGGDFATGPDALTDVQSSWLAFATAHGITDSNVGNYLGSWGVDVADGDAWAVVDHNSSFSVDLTAVPEPTFAAFFVVAPCLLLIRRRRATTLPPPPVPRGRAGVGAGLR